MSYSSKMQSKDKDESKRKPGPKPERLVIEDDPGEALDRLLRVVKKRAGDSDKTSPEEE